MSESGGGRDFDLTRVADVVDLKSGRRASASPVADLGGLGESVLDRFTATGAPSDPEEAIHPASGASTETRQRMSDSAALDWRRPPVRPAESGRDGRLRPVAFMHRLQERVHYAGRARRRKTAPARTLRGWRRAAVAASVVAIAVGAAAAAFEIPGSHGTGGSHGPVTEAAGIAGGALDGFAPKPNVSRLAGRQSSRRSDLHKRQRLVPPDTAKAPPR